MKKYKIKHEADDNEIIVDQMKSYFYVQVKDFSGWTDIGCFTTLPGAEKFIDYMNTNDESVEEANEKFKPNKVGFFASWFH